MKWLPRKTGERRRSLVPHLLASKTNEKNVITHLGTILNPQSPCQSSLTLPRRSLPTENRRRRRLTWTAAQRYLYSFQVSLPTLKNYLPTPITQRHGAASKEPVEGPR